MSLSTVPIENGSNLEPLYAKSSSSDSKSWEGRKVTKSPMNTCKVGTLFIAVLIGTTVFSTICLDHEKYGVRGLNPRTYEVIDAGLVLTLAACTYTRGRERFKDPFEQGKVRSYEVFLVSMAVQTAVYSLFFFTSSSKADPLSSGVYAASTTVVLGSLASARQTHLNAVEDMDEEASEYSLNLLMHEYEPVSVGVTESAPHSEAARSNA